MANAIVTINRRAKQIKRDHPGKAWKACIEQASREYRSKSKKPAARKKAKRSTAKKVNRSVRKKTNHSPSPGRSLSNATPAQLKNALRMQLKEKEDRAVIQKYHATKKRTKKQIQKRIVAIRSELRKIS